MKIIATRTDSETGNDHMIKFEIVVNAFEEKGEMRSIATYYSDGNTVDFWSTGLPAVQLKNDPFFFYYFNTYINLVNYMTFLTQGMARKIKDSGFVWSEMRRKCEISVESSIPAHKLTYRKTGMPESETIFVNDGTTHKLFRVINGILFD